VAVVVDHAPVGRPGAQVADDAAGPGRAVPERGFPGLDRILEDEIRRRLRVDLSHVDPAAPVRVVHGSWLGSEKIRVNVLLAHRVAPALINVSRRWRARVIDAAQRVNKTAAL